MTSLLAMVLASAAIGGYIGYQLGALRGWAAGFRRRDELSAEFEPTLLSMERHVGWHRGRAGWATPDHPTHAAETPVVLQ